MLGPEDLQQLEGLFIKRVEGAKFFDKQDPDRAIQEAIAAVSAELVEVSGNFSTRISDLETDLAAASAGLAVEISQVSANLIAASAGISTEVNTVSSQVAGVSADFYAQGDPTLYVGDGAEGALVVSGSQTINSVRTRVNGDSNAGDNIVRAGAISSFAAGDHILVHQTVMQASAAAISAGAWEVAKVSSINASVSQIITEENIVHNYANTGAQVIKLPEYTTVLFKSGGSIADAAWDGTTGGLIGLYASKGIYVDKDANVGVSAKGFRGGAGSTGVGNQGEGVIGTGTQSVSANYTGGGGGNDNGGTGSDGAAGGNFGTGSDADTGTAKGGKTILNVNTKHATEKSTPPLIFGGGGGGNHASTGGNERTGGRGGGAALFISPFISIAGTLTAVGASGSASSGNSGPGASGTIGLICKQIAGISNVKINPKVIAAMTAAPGHVFQGYVDDSLPTS